MTVAHIANHRPPGILHTQEAMTWASRQIAQVGEYRKVAASEAAVLYYLTFNAFISADNYERAKPGQIRRDASSHKAIMAHTGLTSGATVRKATSMLASDGLLLRWYRNEPCAPLGLALMWSVEDAVNRDAIRSGAMPRPEFYDGILGDSPFSTRQ